MLITLITLSPVPVSTVARPEAAQRLPEAAPSLPEAAQGAVRASALPSRRLATKRPEAETSAMNEEARAAKGVSA